MIGVKRRIVLLGPPASGKGTQAEFVQKRFGISTTSTGAILRAEAKRGTAVGMTAAGIISKGSLAPDELVLQLVANEPCPNCGGKLEVRNDDNLGVLARRMKEYQEKTVPVTDFYDSRGILARLDASRVGKAVLEDVSELIEA